MKVLPFEIPKPDKSALIFQIDDQEKFYANLHQHKEIQLSIIISGEGDLLVADTASRYQAGDIFIIGSNLPHLFKSDQDSSHSLMFTLFFTEDSFGKGFFDLPELRQISKLMEKIKNGIRIESHKAQIHGLFEQLESSTRYERIILFLQIMNFCHKAKTSHLSSYNHHKLYSENEGSRMNKVMTFAMEEFQRNITLEEIASVASMTPNAFCRFFKQRTRKTFFEFLYELRIDHAARMLRNQPEMSIQAIAEDSGFANISNFNRKFKSIKGKTPSTFRRQ